jgi:hypothetical protein
MHNISAAIGGAALLLYLISCIPQNVDCGSDGTTERIVFVERMNQDDPNQSFMVAGKGNHISQIVTETSACANVLDYVSDDRAFLSLLSDKGFEAVSCVGEHDGKVEVLQKEIAPMPEHKRRRGDVRTNATRA